MAYLENGETSNLTSVIHKLVLKTVTEFRRLYWCGSNFIVNAVCPKVVVSIQHYIVKNIGVPAFAHT